MARTGRPSTAQEVECANCGTQLKKAPSEIARNKTGKFFCSTTCRNAVGSKPKTGHYKQCEQCGKDYWVKPSTEHIARFCSRECRDNANRVGTETRTCQGCGNDFEFNLVMKKWNVGTYCSRACNRQHRYDQSIGRTRVNKDGYVMVKAPDHPAAHRNGWVLQHRIVMESMLGRYLGPDENVHHINGKRNDNSEQNLELWNVSQPPGQRVSDKVDWAVALLEQYAPHLLKG